MDELQRPQRRQYTFPYKPDNQIEIYLNTLAEKYQIDRQLVDRLYLLEDFEIVILCDDSESMNILLNESAKTRWQQLKEIINVILHITTIFDENGVDLYFIRRSALFDITDPDITVKCFTDIPQGYGSLVPLLQHIFRLPASEIGKDKKLLVFIATDEIGDNAFLLLEKVMKYERQSDTTHVIFLVFNDDLAIFQQFSKWKSEMKNVDVILGYKNEQKNSFLFNQYIIKTLLDTLDKFS